MEKKLKISDFAALVGTSQKTVYSRLSNPDNLPVNEQLKSVSEKVRGRETTFIVTSDEQIQLYQKIFNYLPVSEGNYEDNLTYNNSSPTVNDFHIPSKSFNNNEITVNVLNQIINVNNDLNERYEQKINDYVKVKDELAELKSTQKLLEDKAGREGYYIKEINELEKGNNELKTVNIELKKDNEVLLTDNNKLMKNNKWLLTGLITFFIISVLSVGIITGIVCYYRALQDSQPINNLQEQVINDKKPAEVQEVVTPPAPQQVKKVVQNKRK